LLNGGDVAPDIGGLGAINGLYVIFRGTTLGSDPSIAYFDHALDARFPA
jgi:hypothetical protein